MRVRVRVCVHVRVRVRERVGVRVRVQVCVHVHVQVQVQVCVCEQVRVPVGDHLGSAVELGSISAALDIPAPRCGSLQNLSQKQFNASIDQFSPACWFVESHVALPAVTIGRRTVVD